MIRSAILEPITGTKRQSKEGNEQQQARGHHKRGAAEPSGRKIKAKKWEAKERGKNDGAEGVGATWYRSGRQALGLACERPMSCEQPTTR